MNTLLICIDIEKLKESAKKTSTNGARARNKLEILTRDNFRCVICKKQDKLTIAHKIPLAKYNHKRHNCRNSSSYKLDECITLCCDCHLEYENCDIIAVIKIHNK